MRFTSRGLPDTARRSTGCRSPPPRLQLRILNHWDNLDGTVERGYAGASIWDWHKLPDYIDPRYEQYARACASVGIERHRAHERQRERHRAAAARTSRRLPRLPEHCGHMGFACISARRFSAPIEMAALKTADPLDAGVQVVAHEGG